MGCVHRIMRLTWWAASVDRRALSRALHRPTCWRRERRGFTLLNCLIKLQDTLCLAVFLAAGFLKKFQQPLRLWVAFVVQRLPRSPPLGIELGGRVRSLTDRGFGDGQPPSSPRSTLSFTWQQLGVATHHVPMYGACEAATRREERQHGNTTIVNMDYLNVAIHIMMAICYTHAWCASSSYATWSFAFWRSFVTGLHRPTCAAQKRRFAIEHEGDARTITMQERMQEGIYAPDVVAVMTAYGREGEGEGNQAQNGKVNARRVKTRQGIGFTTLFEIEFNWETGPLSQKS